MDPSHLRAAPSGANSEARPSELAGESVYWDIVDEHLSEAAYAVEALRRLQHDPLLRLLDQATWGESRLDAHIDALAIAGPEVLNRRLVPILTNQADSDEVEGTHVTVAACALLSAGWGTHALPGLAMADVDLRRACVTGFQWAASDSAALLARLPFAASQAELTGLLEALAARSQTVPELHTYLTSEHPAVVLQAAASAVRHAPSAAHFTAVEALLRHEDATVVRAALLPSLAFGSTHAFATLRGLAAGLEPADGHLMALYAALGNRADHQCLAEFVQLDSHREAAVFALGFSGNVAYARLLLDFVGGVDARVAVLAAQALSVLLGIDLRDDGLFSPPSPEAASDDAADALPAFEDDDLDASLLPLPEEALDRPNPAAFASHVDAAEAALDPSLRYLRGEPLSAARLLAELREGPLRTRHVLADCLYVLSGGTANLDTTALAQTQLRKLEALGHDLRISLPLSLGGL